MRTKVCFLNNGGIRFVSANNYDYQQSFRDAILESIQPWVEWKHISKGLTHCETCLTLDQCWFVTHAMPLLPQHPYCHCTTIPISTSQVRSSATAKSDYSKFDPYLFDPADFYQHGKRKMFESWGYNIADSQWLKAEIEKQGLEKYIAGQYTLHALKPTGQQINIIVEIPRKDKPEKTVTFTTGWKVYPKGHIQLVTPYGDK